ncbi:MAG TPA: tetratricopeptide repeat protein [Polyangiaceae bacterium]|nr:tetratricopeptide repeat protein [Polyangiaceae bacterium]
MKREAASVEAPQGDDQTGESRPPTSLPPEGIALSSRVRENPADEEAWDELDEIARNTQKPDSVSQLYRETLSRTLSVDSADRIARRAVAFHDEWFEDPALVIQILKRTLDIDPRSEWAFERLSLLFTMAERWDDLLAAYDVALAACTDKEKKKALLDEAARIAKDFAGSTDRAIQYLKQLVPLRPEDAQLAQSLERRLLLQKRHRDLVDVWSARLPVLSPAEVLSTRVRMAETWLEKLSDAKTALGVVREILSAPGGDAQADKLLEKIGTFASSPLEARREALGLLKERLSAAGKSEDVVRVIELLLGVADAPEERVELRAEATRRLSEAGRFSDAAEHAAEWLVLAPSLDIKNTLEELAGKAEKFERYADALVRAAIATKDGSLRVDFTRDGGRTRVERLGDVRGGIELFSRVLDDEAASDEARLDVARRLASLLSEPDDAKRRLAVLERLLALEPDAAEQKRILGDAARLAAALGETDHALDLWNRRLERDPADAEALDATVDLLEAHHRWDALVRALEKRHDASSDPASRRADLVRIADTQKTRLDDLPAAIDAYRRVEKEFGATPDTMDALADLSAAAQRWSDVTALLREAAQRVDEPDRRAAHLARMGDVYRSQREAPLRAVEAYRDALDILPVHEGAREGLRALLDDGDAGGLAVEALAKAYATAGEWQGTLALVERRVYRAKDDAFRRDVLVEAAHLLERRGEDRASALGYLRRAFALLREPEIETELVRLAEESDGWAACAAGYAEAIAAESNEDRLAELLLSHGGIVEKRLADPAAALASYARVAALRPGELPPTVALVRVAGLTGKWDVAADALARSAFARGAVDPSVVSTFEESARRAAGFQAATAALETVLARSNSEDPGVLHDLERKLAIWHRDERDDADAAEAVLKRAVSHKTDPETLRMLADLERRSPGRPLVETLLRLAAATDDDLEVYREAGNIALLVVRDPALSRPILERVLDLASARWTSAESSGSDPDSFPGHALWALEQLVALFLDAKKPDGAADLLERGAKLPLPADRSRDLRYRAAELAAEQIGDTARAVELCRGILREEPGDVRAIALLARLYGKEGRLEELLDLRRAELALGPETERRLVLRLDVARVLGELSRSADERIAALRDNLADLPGHVPTIDALSEVLEAAGRTEELYDELTRQAALVEARGEAHAAAELWARGGRVAEKASRIEPALEAYRRSVALEPNLAVYDSLAAIHRGRGEHGAAVGWLEKRLERTGRSPAELEERRDAVLRLARAHEASGSVEAAEGRLAEALGSDPAATTLRAFLAELYRAGQKWAELGPLLADGVDYAGTDAEKVTLLRQAASVQRWKLASLGAAIPLLEHAAQLAPEDRSVRLALADALRSAGRFEEAKDILEAMLAEFGRRRTPERAAVHYHLARIAKAQGDLDQALTQLEAASSIERTDPKILKLLGDVARQKGEVDAAERAYRALLLIVRRQQPAAEPSESESDEEVVAASEVMFDLHQMAQEQGQSDRANDLLESAFETAASNNVEALRLERALRSAGQTDLVLRVLDTRLERITDPSAAAEILVARADLLAETGRLGEALGSLLDALGKTPSSVPLLTSARDLAIRADALPRYVSRLAELASAAEKDDPLLASDLWMRLGTMEENELANAEKAAEFYERSLGTGRRALRAYRALLRTVPETDAERVARVTRAFVEASDQDETDGTPRNEALYRLAELELGSAGTADAGALRLEQALERAPDYDRALELVTPAVLRAPESVAVVRVYEKVARAIGDDALVLDALTLRSALPDMPLEVLQDAVELARVTKDGDRLSVLLHRLVAFARKEERTADFVWALTDLARIRESEQSFGSAAELLEEAAKHTTGTESFDLRLRVAEFAAGPLGNPRRAAEVYESLRKEEPADSRVWKPLLDVYRKLRAWKDLEACIASTVEAVYDPAERNHLRMERGRILLEDPSRQEEAETVLREVLDEDPDHVQASVVLAELLERTQRFDELNELLTRQLEGARERRDANGVAALSLRIGRTLEQTDRAAAMALYKESIEVADADRALLEALLRLYGPDDDPTERAEVLERLLDLETGEPAARLALELASLAEARNDAGAVERALRRGYEANPENVELRDRLVSYYTESQDYGGLSDVLVADARGRKNAREAVGQFREAAILQLERLGDPARAAEILAEAHAALPEDVDVVLLLTSALVDASRADEALAVVTDTLAQNPSPAEARARLFVERARLRPRVFERNPTALAEGIADLDQASALVEGGFADELVALLEEQRVLASETGDEETERAATMRLAHLLPRVGDQRRGLELLVAWVKQKPNDADAVRGLGQFAANAEKWSAAAKAYQRLVEITDGPDQIDAVVRLAEACERSGSPMEARPFLEMVHEKAPGDELVRTRLRRMYEAAGAYAELAAIMIAEAEHATDEGTKFDRLMEAGDLSLRVEGGERTAIDAYRRAYTIKPEEHRVVQKLADALGAVGEIEEAATLLDRAIDAFGKRRSPELSELQHCMARIGRLAGDWEAVFAWLDAAVQTDRQNGAAASELALVAMEREEWDIAVKALQVITLLKGEAPMSKAEAYLRQGIIAEKKGDPKKAIFLAKRALTQEPDYADAKAFIDRLGG